MKVFTVCIRTRDDILAAAIVAFEEHVEAGLSLRDVAAGGVSVMPMALYRYYEDGQALHDAIIATATGAHE